MPTKTKTPKEAKNNTVHFSVEGEFIMDKLKILPDFYKLPTNTDLVEIPFEDLLKIEKSTIDKIFEDDERKIRVENCKRTTYTPTIDSYISAQKEIDKKLKDPIKPNPITDMNNAGWLAPNGDWYGLNGNIANQLHNQIADALLEAGIIKLEKQDLGNPDGHLSRKGWAKVHQHNVLYEGYSYAKRGLGPRIKMTKEQIHALHKYGQHFIIKGDTPYLALGLAGMGGVQSHKVSAVRFEYMTDEELEQMFDF